jgi:hypothetical protein
MTSSETVSEKRSLYDRLGGVYSIATVVEDLIDRVMVDPRLNANPLVDEAHHKLGHTRLPDIDAQLEEFAVDPRRAPERVGKAHIAA